VHGVDARVLPVLSPVVGGGKGSIVCGAAARGEAPRSSAGGASGSFCRFSLCCRQPVS
jgi:hypothetical protein